MTSMLSWIQGKIAVLLEPPELNYDAVIETNLSSFWVVTSLQTLRRLDTIRPQMHESLVLSSLDPMFSKVTLVVLLLHHEEPYGIWYCLHVSSRFSVHGSLERNKAF